ncbi:cinnamoyl-CoA reductase 1-like [Andrographis paniculata]|uniref:cinnamoyl-CoA reductase 1-like n=1 Tax=Andrographis paniculata TaxID=175694 RepID=UPI0021E8D4BB|nr:cinnamoyl-CoA reductase 1-like [Andrographis paniculata]
MAEDKKGKVCVTGAGGYIASWLVKLLLSHGYHVHATLRDPDDEKNAHLKDLKNAAEKMKTFKAELLDYGAIREAVNGCHGVFHIASPVPIGTPPNPEVEVVKPAIEGTLNVLKACSEAGVKRVVIMSSVAAIIMNPNWPEDRAMDETSWSDAEYCKTTDDSAYFYAKTMAERAAWEYAATHGLDLITMCPPIVIGPKLQPAVNASSFFIVLLLSGGFEGMEKGYQKLVDVRDVAEAMKLVYETPEAEGRYICSAHMVESQELVQMLKDMYPDYEYPESYIEGNTLSKLRLSSEKLQRLGWKYRPLKETLVDSIENYKQSGVLS